MATKTFDELKQLAIQIRDEKTNKQNTATRVGTTMLEHINKLEQDYYDKTTINNRTSEYNVSLNHPTSGISGGNKYDLSTAIGQVPAELRTDGFTVSFLNADGNTEKWEFAGGSWLVSSFSQVGDLKFKELEKKIQTYKRGYITRTNGTTLDHPSIFFREGYIPLLDGETQINYIGEAKGNAAAAICFYDEGKNFISSLPSGTETVHEIKDAPIPSNAKYIRYSNSFGFTLSIYTNVRQIEYMPLTEIASIKDVLETVKSVAETTEVKVDNIKNAVLNINNEIDQSNLGGTSKEIPSFFGTTFFENDTPLEYSITQIVYQSNTAYKNNKLIIFDYLKDKNRVIVSYIENIEDAQVGENTINVNLTIKKGQALFILGNDVYKGGTSNILGTGNNIINVRIDNPDNLKIGDVLVVSSSVKAIKCIRIIGTYKSVLTTEEVNKLIDKKINQGGEFDKVSNYLKDKILCVTGDSEAAGHSVPPKNTYSGLIASRNNMKIYNTAVNGRKLAYVEGNTGSGTPLVQAIDEIREDADYILSHIGYNDSFDESEDDESKDITKYKGAFNTVIEGWQSRCPKARIGIIIPYYFNRQETRIKRAEWMKKRCEYYHIQYIDGTIKSGLNYDSTEQKELYFIDSVHLTVIGHERVSYIYEQFLRGL